MSATWHVYLKIKTSQFCPDDKSDTYEQDQLLDRLWHVVRSFPVCVLLELTDQYTVRFMFINASLLFSIKLMENDFLSFRPGVWTSFVHSKSKFWAFHHALLTLSITQTGTQTVNPNCIPNMTKLRLSFRVLGRLYRKTRWFAHWPDTQRYVYERSLCTRLCKKPTWCPYLLMKTWTNIPSDALVWHQSRSLNSCVWPLRSIRCWWTAVFWME